MREGASQSQAHHRGQLRKSAGQPETVTALGLASPPPIHVQCDAFEGTLATLFLCVRDHKVSLNDVPLAPICEAYLNYLIQTSSVYLDEAAAALTALAYLLERKAWGLLPSPEEEPEEEVFDEEALALTSHIDAYEEVIDVLKVFREAREKMFFRPAMESVGALGPDLDLGQVTSGDLATAMEALLKRAKPDLSPPHLRPRRNLADVMAEVLGRLSVQPARLETMMPEEFTRTDVVFVFLALLELIRLGQASAVLGEGEEVLFARRG